MSRDHLGQGAGKGTAGGGNDRTRPCAGETRQDGGPEAAGGDGEARRVGLQGWGLTAIRTDGFALSEQQEVKGM